MPLFRLIYCSRASVTPQTAPALRAIVKAAQKRNAEDEITGMLCYGRPYFFQCLEGAQVAVCRTMLRIFRDLRHKDIVLIEARAVDQRTFPDWSMGLVAPSELAESFFKNLYEEMATGSSPNAAEQLLALMMRLVDWSIPCTNDCDESGAGTIPLQVTRFGTSV